MYGSVDRCRVVVYRIPMLFRMHFSPGHSQSDWVSASAHSLNRTFSRRVRFMRELWVRTDQEVALASKEIENDSTEQFSNKEGEID